MYNFFKKIFKTNKKFTLKDSSFLKIYKSTEISKLFDSISNFNDTSEIRYVGGCVRKILNQEDVDDIDLAVNLNPNQVKECLQSNNINPSGVHFELTPENVTECIGESYNIKQSNNK